ncbi:MAG: DUF3493 domain-containing protein [Thermostichus sp. DG_1_6_bins_120]
MDQPDPKSSLDKSPLLQRRDLLPADRVRLLTELASPYRGLRQFIYLAVGSSASLGAFVFFFRALAGRNLSVTLPSLVLQLGILAAMLGLNHLENRSRQRLSGQVQQRLGVNPSRSCGQPESAEPDD